MSSIGINLASWMKKGLLQFQSTRPTFTGMEMHLIMMYEAIDAFQPQVVIVDPLNSFLATESQMDIKSMFMRLVDNLKSRNITGLFTTLTLGGEALEETDLAISSLIDTWILLRVIESDDIRNRGVYILKSRGMAHSNRIRNFLLTDHGVELVDA
jgi:circadian clock protein KaiC